MTKQYVNLYNDYEEMLASGTKKKLVTVMNALALDYLKDKDGVFNIRKYFDV